ncbi:MAG: hypothetical protein J7L47_03880 [Candidatus Odinarchaeota archaeon]|nr:hypothetical protein [Candidatus Odinarchaeota archaeon]
MSRKIYLLQKKHFKKYLQTLFLAISITAIALIYLATPAIAPVIPIYVYPVSQSIGYYGEKVGIDSIGGTIEHFSGPRDGWYFSEGEFTYFSENSPFFPNVYCTETDIAFWEQNVYGVWFKTQDYTTVAQGPTSGTYKKTISRAGIVKILGSCLGHFREWISGSTWTLESHIALDNQGHYSTPPLPGH